MAAIGLLAGRRCRGAVVRPPEGESEGSGARRRVQGSPSGPARRAAAQPCPLTRRARRTHSAALPGVLLPTAQPAGLASPSTAAAARSGVLSRPCCRRRPARGRDYTRQGRERAVAGGAARPAVVASHARRPAARPRRPADVMASPGNLLRCGRIELAPRYSVSRFLRGHPALADCPAQLCHVAPVDPLNLTSIGLPRANNRLIYAAWIDLAMDHFRQGNDDFRRPGRATPESAARQYPARRIPLSPASGRPPA